MRRAGLKAEQFPNNSWQVFLMMSFPGYLPAARLESWMAGYQLAWILVINVISQDVSKLPERDHDTLGVLIGVRRRRKQIRAALHRTFC